MQENLGSCLFGTPIYVHWSNLFLPLVALARDYPEPFISSFIVVLFGPALILMVLLVSSYFDDYLLFGSL